MYITVFTQMVLRHLLCAQGEYDNIRILGSCMQVPTRSRESVLSLLCCQFETLTRYIAFKGHVPVAWNLSWDGQFSQVQSVIA